MPRRVAESAASPQQELARPIAGVVLKAKPAVTPVLVELHDMRYGWPTSSPESLWPLRFEFDGAGRVGTVRRCMPTRRFGLRTILAEMWKENFDP